MSEKTVGQIVKEFLTWLRTALPLLILNATRNHYKKKAWNAEREIEEKELENEQLRNEVEIEKTDRNRPSSSIIDDAIRDGESLRGSNKK